MPVAEKKNQSSLKFTKIEYEICDSQLNFDYVTDCTKVFLQLLELGENAEKSILWRILDLIYHWNWQNLA